MILVNIIQRLPFSYLQVKWHWETHEYIYLGMSTAVTHVKPHFTLSENVSNTFKYKECDQNYSWARLRRNALFKKPKTSHLKG
jgi:hypothetical protein